MGSMPYSSNFKPRYHDNFPIFQDDIAYCYEAGGSVPNVLRPRDLVLRPVLSDTN